MASNSGNISTVLRQVEADLTGPALGQFLARSHGELHGQVMASQSRRGTAPDFEHVVDGRRNVSLDQARRQIVTLYDHRREIAQVALAAVRAAGPAGSGQWRAGVRLYVDGVAHDEVPAGLPEGAEIAIVATADYARRIEIGKTKAGRAFVISAPYRHVEQVARKIVAPVWREIADVSFTYFDIDHPYILKGGHAKRAPLVKQNARSSAFRQGRARRQVGKDRRRGEAVRYPAIVIRLK